MTLLDRLAPWKSVWRDDAAGDSPLAELLAGERLGLVDVGARGGLHPRFRPYGRLVRAVGLEPDAEECRRLEGESRARGDDARFLPIALASARGELSLHRCREPGCSSVFRPSTRLFRHFSRELAAHFEVVGETRVPAAPLDELATELGFAPDCLKLDVQGAELDVLLGAKETLARVKLVEVEVELAPQYEGQPLFGDVDRFLRERGFGLLGLRRSHWRRRAGIDGHPSLGGGQLVHADALYWSERGEAELGSVPELVKWAMALSAYRQHDFVASLCLEHPASASLSEAQRKALLARLIPGTRPLWGALRRALAPIHELSHETLRHWVTALRTPPAVDWHDADFF